MVDLLVGYGGYNVPDGGGSNPPTPPIPPVNSATVSSIADLKSYLLDDSLDEIIVTNGTYIVAGATQQAATSLYIGSAYANRTRPINIKAQTIGGVTFSGNNANFFCGIIFLGGAHSQTWQGFNWGNGTPTGTGVVVFGGYAGVAPAHHITMRDTTILSTIDSPNPGATDHSIYFSRAASGGAHDLIIDGLTVQGGGNVHTALHFFGSDASNPNVHDVTVRNMNVTAGTKQAIMLWDSSMYNILIEDSTIDGASEYGVRYQQNGQVVLDTIVTTNSGITGFFTSLSSTPNLQKINCTFDV